jgi:hypothetical protein
MGPQPPTHLAHLQSADELDAWRAAAAAESLCRGGASVRTRHRSGVLHEDLQQERDAAAQALAALEARRKTLKREAATLSDAAAEATHALRAAEAACAKREKRLRMLEAFAETGGTAHGAEKVHGGENDHHAEIEELTAALKEQSHQRQGEASEAEHARAESKHAAGKLARLDEEIRDRRADGERLRRRLLSLEASHSKYLRFARRSPRAELPPLDSDRADGADASPRAPSRASPSAKAVSITEPSQTVPRSMLRAIRTYQRGLVDQRAEMFAPTSFTSEASRPAQPSLNIARAFGKAPPARSIFAELAKANAAARGTYDGPSPEFADHVADAGLTVEHPGGVPAA